MESSVLAKEVAEILKNKNAKDLNILDIKNRTILADYFIICSGISRTHIKTLIDELELQLKKMDTTINHVEGHESLRWVLIDLGSVIVHIFHQEEREFYNLERLWINNK